MPVFWCFSRFPRHLTYFCQTRYSFSVQCLQYFRLDFVLTSRFSGFQSSIVAISSVDVKTFSFQKLIVSHVSVGVALNRFKKYSKYYLHRKRNYFSSLKMFPIESLMEIVVFKHFPHLRRMVCQNTLHVDEWLKPNRLTNSSQECSLYIFLRELYFLRLEIQGLQIK